MVFYNCSNASQVLSEEELAGLSASAACNRTVVDEVGGAETWAGSFTLADTGLAVLARLGYGWARAHVSLEVVRNDGAVRVLNTSVNATAVNPRALVTVVDGISGQPSSFLLLRLFISLRRTIAFPPQFFRYIFLDIIFGI